MNPSSSVPPRNWAELSEISSQRTEKGNSRVTWLPFSSFQGRLCSPTPTPRKARFPAKRAFGQKKKNPLTLDISPPLLAFLFSRGRRRRRRGNLLLLFLLAKSLRGTAEETFADYSICHFSREILLRLRSNYSINFPISRYAEYSFAQRGAPAAAVSFLSHLRRGRRVLERKRVVVGRFYCVSLVSPLITFFGMKLLIPYVYIFVYKNFLPRLILFFSPSRHQWEKLPPPFFNPPPHTPRSPSGLGGKRGKKEK